MHRNHRVTVARFAVRTFSRTSTARRGFTLLETFVAITIVGVLVSLLFTAVQMARESARKTQCANNLREIGIAAELFRDSTKKSPFERQPGPSVSWRVRLLPFLGEKALSDAYDTGREWLDPVNEPLRTRMPALYDCPNARSEPRERASYTAIQGGSGGSFGAAISRWTNREPSRSESPLVLEVNDEHATVWLRPGLDVLHRGDPGDPLPEDPTVEEMMQYLRGNSIISNRGLIGHHSGGFHALYEDGTVRFARELIDDDTLRAMAEGIVSQTNP